MTRAEQSALKAYPKEEGKVWRSAFGIIEFDKTAPERIAYQKGYEQAEKDLALTTDDLWRIFNLAREMRTKYSSTKRCLQEVADIFNSQREKK